METNKFVNCYFNLHKQVFSVKQGRLPVIHFEWLRLGACSFHVNQGGRNRVLLERRKNVHAFVKGMFLEGKNILSDVIVSPPTIDLSAVTKIRYNPYLYNHFFEDGTDKPVYEVEEALLLNKQVFKLK